MVEELFEYLLSKTEWVTLTARATIGEELPQGADLNGQSWLGFIEGALKSPKMDRLKPDLGILLIFVESMLNNHILARSHYPAFFGKNVTDPKLKKRTAEHSKTILRAVLSADLGKERTNWQASLT